MAILDYFSSDHDGEWTEVYGHRFRWSSKHLSAESLKPMLYTYDKLAEDCLNRLDEISPPPSKTLPRGQPKLSGQEAPISEEKSVHRDLYALIKDNAETDEKVGRLWRQINTVPDWVDWDQIERGQKVFYRYGGPNLTALTFLSLLGGLGSGRIVETLARTGGFGVQVVKRRLLETTQHILQVTRDLESIKSDGDGFKSSVRVRLLHTHVRRRIMQLAKERSSYYSVEEFGIPVNDLDSIGTIVTFSGTLIWLGLPRQGIFLRKQEIEDYIALWRYIAYILGTPDKWFESPERCKVMMESLMVSQLKNKATPTSRALANNIIEGLHGQPPLMASRGFLCAETYWLNGRELAQTLGIERPNLYHQALMAGQCIFFMFWCYINRSIPSWDEAKIDLTRKLTYKVLILNKEAGLGKETNFDFKYIPNFNNMSTAQGEKQQTGLIHSGIEWRGLKALVIATGVIGAMTWIVFTGISSLSGRILN